MYTDIGFIVFLSCIGLLVAAAGLWFRNVRSAAGGSVLSTLKDVAAQEDDTVDLFDSKNSTHNGPYGFGYRIGGSYYPE